MLIIPGITSAQLLPPVETSEAWAGAEAGLGLQWPIEDLLVAQKARVGDVYRGGRNPWVRFPGLAALAWCSAIMKLEREEGSR